MTKTDWAYPKDLNPLGRWRSDHGFVRLLLRGIVAGFSGTFLSMLLMALTQILIVRELSVLLYGEYAAIAATLGLLTIALGVGLDTWILHEVSCRPERLATAIWDVLLLKAVGTLALVGMLMLAWSTRLMNLPALLLGAVGIVFDAFAKTGYSGLRALKHNRTVALVQTLSALVLLGLIWSWVQVESLTVLIVFGLQAVVNGLTAGFLLWHVWHLAYQVIPQGWRIGELLRGSGMLMTSDALATVYGQSVVVLLGALVGASAVGLFLPALKLITYTFIIPGIVFNVGLPILNTSIRQGHGFTRTIGLMLGLMTCYGLAVIIGFWWLGAPIITLVFGNDFAATVPLAQMMAVVTLLKGFNMISATILVVTERLRARVFVQFLVALFSVLSSLWLIPIHGLYGAVAVVIASEILLFVGYTLSASIATYRTATRLRSSPA